MWDTDDTRFSEDVELPLKDGQSKQESGLLHIRSKFVGGEAQDGRQQQVGSMEGSSVVQEGQVASRWSTPASPPASSCC